MQSVDMVYIGIVDATDAFISESLLLSNLELKGYQSGHLRSHILKTTQV